MSTPGGRAANPHHERRWAILAMLGIAQLMVDPRRDDREHRAAVGAEGARLLQREPPVGRHRLRARVRQPAAARRPPRRPLRPQVDLHRRPDRLRRWPRRSAAPPRASACSSRARALQGAFGALLAPSALGAADDDVHRPRRARQGVRHLRRDRRRRRGARPAARRDPHRVPVLALVPVREPPVRDPGRRRARCACSSTSAHPQRPRLDIPGVAAR